MLANSCGLTFSAHFSVERSEGKNFPVRKNLILMCVVPVRVAFTFKRMT